MTRRAYYNEIDPYAADWLRNLIAAGHIAPGVVDTRSIVDVLPSDLDGFTQCHFFAGIGVWSHALRLAGWPDDRPVWTGSCPCQPFSAAGKGAGFSDQRHLWPAWHHLISECRPGVVFGEQVASADGLGWLDLVHADMEAAGYACGAVDLCAAGVGAPHIRQRLWFVADSALGGHSKHQRNTGTVGGARSGDEGQEPKARRIAQAAGHRSEARLLGDASDTRLAQRIGNGRVPGGQSGADAGQAPERAGVHAGELAYHDDAGQRRESSLRLRGQPFHDADRRSPLGGFWAAADWIPCRDGKWRPVEPGTFPLAHGAPARVGRLRAYGNAINAEAAREFIASFLDCELA